MYKAPANTNQCMWAVNGEFVCSSKEPLVPVTLDAKPPVTHPAFEQPLTKNTVAAMAYSPKKVINLSKITTPPPAYVKSLPFQPNN